MKKISNVLWGVVLIAVGALIALNAFEVTNIDIFFDGWWTLFLIVPCFIGLFTEHDRTGNIIGLLIGVFLLLCCQGLMSFGLLWKLAIPVVIIIIGLKLIFNGVWNNKSGRIIQEMKADGKELKNGYAAFSGTNMNFDGEVFEGAELTAVFGGVKCDLTRAVIERDCVINASAIFGGIDILVPDGVNVTVRSTSLFGGVSDKRRQKSNENTVTVYVNATCIFGGVDIK